MARTKIEQRILAQKLKTLDINTLTVITKINEPLILHNIMKKIRALTIEPELSFADALAKFRAARDALTEQKNIFIYEKTRCHTNHQKYQNAELEQSRNAQQLQHKFVDYFLQRTQMDKKIKIRENILRQDSELIDDQKKMIEAQNIFQSAEKKYIEKKQKKHPLFQKKLKEILIKYDIERNVEERKIFADYDAELNNIIQNKIAAKIKKDASEKRVNTIVQYDNKIKAIKSERLNLELANKENLDQLDALNTERRRLKNNQYSMKRYEERIVFCDQQLLINDGTICLMGLMIQEVEREKKQENTKHNSKASAFIGHMKQIFMRSKSVRREEAGSIDAIRSDYDSIGFSDVIFNSTLSRDCTRPTKMWSLPPSIPEIDSLEMMKTQSSEGATFSFEGGSEGPKNNTVMIYYGSGGFKP